MPVALNREHFHFEVLKSRQSGWEDAMSWQLQEAKQKFSELVRRAIQEGPQVVTRHGEEVAVLVSAEAYRRLTGSEGRDFKQFLLRGPDLSELEIERSTEQAREVGL
jgi:prevent-host-death family protein